MSEAIISFENVSKKYPHYHHFTGGLKYFLLHFAREFKKLRNSQYEAFHDISFTIDRGETFGIIGKNGAGKSTALGLMAGVLRPTTGKVTVKGKVSPLLELGAGFHVELTGAENIVLNGILLGLTKKEVLAKFEEIVNFAELEEFIDQPVRVYSSGMLARLGFSIIAHLDPEILLIDEILAVGDFAFQAKCLAKIREFKRNGVTIVLVSHSMKDVEQICDRVAWIENHRLAAIGEPRGTIERFCPGAL